MILKKPPRSFLSHFFISFLAIAVVAWLVALIVNFVNTQTMLRNTYASGIAAQSKILGSSLLEPIKIFNITFLRRQCENAISTDDFDTIQIFDGRGHLLHECHRELRTNPSLLDRGLLKIARLPEQSSFLITDETNARWGEIRISLNQQRTAAAVRFILLPPAMTYAGFLLLILGLSYNLIAREANLLKRLAQRVLDQAERVDRLTEKEENDDLHGLSRETQQIQNSLNYFIEKIVSLNKTISLNSKLAAIGETTTMFAHDVRKPFAMMELFLRQLPERKNDPSFIQDSLNSIEKSKRDINRMIDDLLEFAAPQPPVLEACNPVSLLTSSLGEVARCCKRGDVAIDYDLQHRRLLQVDPAKILRVLNNIITNALEIMPADSRLWFHTQDSQKDGKPFMRVVIGNSGTFIEPHLIAHIFEPFFTRNKKRGTGLGLTICYRLVEFHGGTIEAQSDRTRGTEFSLLLPALDGDTSYDPRELIRHTRDLVSQEATPENHALETETLIKTISSFPYQIKLLMVDDEPLFRTSLRNASYQVPMLGPKIIWVEASSGEEGLAVLEQTRLDLVIADVFMGQGRMDGFEFARQVTGRFPGKPVILHSNLKIADLNHRLTECGAQAFLPKPMEPLDLFRIIAQHVCRATRPAPERPATAASSIAILDDEPLMQEGYQRIVNSYLRGKGDYQVHCFGRSPELLEFVGKYKPRLLFTDVNLLPGDLDGLAVAAQVKKISPQTKIVVVTNEPLPGIRKRALKQGVDEVLPAPLTRESLDQTLRRLL